MRNTTALKAVRLKTPIKIKDITALIGLKSWSKLSRIESGKNAPSWDIVFAYHVIFDIPIDQILPQEALRIRKNIRQRILPYLEDIRHDFNQEDIFNRLNYLKRLYESLKD